MPHRINLAVWGLLFIILAGAAPAQTLRDQVYCRVGQRELRLDLYLPAQQDAARSRFAKDGVGHPVVVWVHGGAWVRGNKKDVPITWLTQQGVAVASVEYRLLREAMFPAPIYDVQAAVRYIRGQANTLGLDPQRIVLSGASAGGHLASLVALTAEDPAKDGRLGGHTDQPLAVAGVIDAFGPTDMNAMIESLQAQDRFAQSREGQILIRLNKSAPGFFDGLSPLKQVTPTAPPFLILHGEDDPLVPLAQSQRLHQALIDADIASTLEVIPNARHGGSAFTDRRRRGLMVQFLHDYWADSPAYTESSR